MFSVMHGCAHPIFPITGQELRNGEEGLQQYILKNLKIMIASRTMLASKFVIAMILTRSRISLDMGEFNGQTHN